MTNNLGVKIYTKEDLSLPKITYFSNAKIEELIHKLGIKRLCIDGPNELINYPRYVYYIYKNK